MTGSQRTTDRTFERGLGALGVVVGDVVAAASMDPLLKRTIGGLAADLVRIRGANFGFLSGVDEISQSVPFSGVAEDWLPFQGVGDQRMTRMLKVIAGGLTTVVPLLRSTKLIVLAFTTRA